MTEEWIRSGLDIVLIVLIGVGLVQATRLIWHLAGLRASRVEMENFIRDFNATVLRAETGIKNLKIAARDNGDELEKLVGKAIVTRDELHFLVESADHLAERLTNTATNASGAARADAKPEIRKSESKPAAPVAATSSPTPFVPPPLAAEPETKPAPKATAPVTPIAARREPEPKTESKPASRAEKELMQALQKLN